MSDTPDRLSAISTMWTVLRAAHGGTSSAADAARELLLHRYGGAVRRYLLGLLRDPHAADDLTQEFGVRLLQGGFHAADPHRGRFRSYVKTSLFHMVHAHARRERRGPAELVIDPAAAMPDDDEAFLESWRAELLGRVWAALEQVNPSLCGVLKCRAENPECPSDELAVTLSARLGRPHTAAGVRQSLKRARALFAELLRAEVAHSLETPTDLAVEEELADLRLLRYVRE